MEMRERTPQARHLDGMPSNDHLLGATPKTLCSAFSSFYTLKEIDLC